MNIEKILTEKLRDAVVSLYSNDIPDTLLQIQETRREFVGDFTAVIFPLVKYSKKSPEITGAEIGEYLLKSAEIIEKYNVVKGFLNLKLSTLFWNKILSIISQNDNFGIYPSSGKCVMVEFSSPNTNKPLHLGHIRNNLLGSSVANLLEANGHKVLRVNLVNDRGIHICKSMLAWKLKGNGETPQNSGIKGDHLVGKYYVIFNELLKNEIEKFKNEGFTEEEALKSSKLMESAQEMLVKWEKGDEEVVSLWRTMNSWVYEGFDTTYKKLGIYFDRTYYESNTYIYGKELVNYGLENGVFFKKENGSVWCDLTSDSLDEKLLLRADGTSVYMTQDLGTARERYNEFKFDEHIYVVGNEQNYHFQVLKLILKRLGFNWADSIYHLSYGMVELPEGKMKSREGTVVDADDLIDDMILTAKETSLELGKLDALTTKEQEELFGMLGLGALKYFILKVDPKKTMLFDPKESIDFNGNTGPFIQYTHARIKSILRKAGEMGYRAICNNSTIDENEISIIRLLNTFPDKIKEAGNEHSPAIIANYCYDLAKEFNHYYHEVSILREENISIREQRLALIEIIAQVLTKCSSILGFSLPERM